MGEKEVKGEDKNGKWGGFDKMRIIRGKRKGIKSKANVRKGEGKIAGYVRQKIKGVKRGSHYLI